MKKRRAAITAISIQIELLSKNKLALFRETFHDEFDLRMRAACRCPALQPADVRAGVDGGVLLSMLWHRGERGRRGPKNGVASSRLLHRANPPNPAC